MRVLVLAYHFPPDPAVGSLRAAKVAEAFRSRGHEVTVIAASHPAANGTRPDKPGLTIHTVRPLPNPREAYVAVKRWMGRGKSPAPAVGTTQDADVMPRAAAWKRYLFSLLWLPDDRQGFIPPAVRAGLREIRRGVDLMYTTSPPHSVHLAGLLLKWLTGVRWAIEFRDPWTGNPGRPSHVTSPLSEALERRLERRTLASVDHIVAVTDGIADLLRDRIIPARRKLVEPMVIRNGIDRLLREPPPAAAATDRPFRILHVGSLYHRRDPRPFLTAFAAFVKSAAAEGRRVQLDLVGDCRWYHGLSVETLAAELGLGEAVTFRDWVPHDESLRLMAEADLLLLFAQDQPTQVPNKLYEYLGTRRPILAFADETGEVARMLRQAGGHYLVTSADGSESEACLRAALASRGLDGAPGNPALLADWTTESQMRRLTEALVNPA